MSLTGGDYLPYCLQGTRPRKDMEQLGSSVASVGTQPPVSKTLGTGMSSMAI